MASEEQIISTKNQLVEWLEAGCKPKQKWRIGTEHEKFPFRHQTHTPIPYVGGNGIQALLNSMQEQTGWEAIYEAENIIGLTDPVSGGAISLEPGGQFELSGAPLKNLHETCSEVHTHLAQLRAAADPLNIGFLGMGFTPDWKREDIPKMPKGRYKIMSNYMPKVGQKGLDMMYRTCTVQVNVDFASENDMVKKFRTSLALQPLATALFANSPFKEGKPSGALSLRSQAWLDTDADRTGMLDFVFEDGFGFERYTDYAVQVPMYFIYDKGNYQDVTGNRFIDFFKGKLAGFEKAPVTEQHWSDHLTTLFPEVRIKRYMEMRGADGGPWKRLCALPAFWVGLLYDDTALDSAWDVAKNWTAEQRNQLRINVTEKGLKAKIGKFELADIAQHVLEISTHGLKSRNNLDSRGESEAHFLDDLKDMVKNKETEADKLLRLYESQWQRNISNIYTDHAY